MDPQMQQECDKKLRELQECMPFLLKVLERLRNNNRNDHARQTQLEKIQKLYNLLNDQTQIFKWDLLVKCERVVNKLKRKMELQGETELFKCNSPTVDEKSQLKASNIDDCPASPPQMEVFDDVQPVVIPTERRCSPPRSNRHRENSHAHHKEYSADRKDGKHSHSYHQHHHHHQHRHQRPNQDDRSVKDDRSKKSSEYTHMRSSSYEQQAVIDQYLSMQRQRDDESRQNCWQRRSHKRESYPESNSWAKSQSSNISSSEQHHGSVFSRLGEKVIDDDSDNFNKNNSAVSRFSTSAPIVSDFLKSPPLSASDITELLNESNTNSNSNDPLSISEIGTRRSTPATSTITKPTAANIESHSPLDIVRRKFALLTKTESAAATSPKPNEILSLSHHSMQSNHLSTKTTAFNDLNKDPTRTTPAERVALKYHPHPRGTTSQSNIPNNRKTDTPSSPSVVPNTNVNVIPTLRPNDPRLRKSNISSSNGNIPALPTSKQIPSLLSLQVLPPNVAKPIHLMSPVSNCSATPSTPSPSYGNIPAAVAITSNPYKVSDPRVQHGRTSTNVHASSTQKRPLLVTGDSSDENWDLDDNAVVFPQPRPFPNQNVSNSAGMRAQNTAQNTLPPRRKSMSWDIGFQPINNAINIPNRMPSIPNIQSTQSNAEESFHNMSWLGGAGHVSALHFNTTFSKHTANEGLGASQHNGSNEYLNYSVPRTYGAYKEARARAAKEQAARKTTDKDKNHKESTGKEQRTDSTETETKLCGNVCLDTTYRYTNLANCELPKTIDFKIPKKTVIAEETSVSKETAKTKSSISKHVEESKPAKLEGCKSEKTKKNSLDMESSAEMEHNISPQQPKSQRPRFSKTNKTPEISRGTKGNSKRSPGVQSTDANAELLQKTEWDINNEVGVSDSEPELVINESVESIDQKQSPAKPKTPLKLEFETVQPNRILKRRCTMVDRASTPEVDKEKLRNSNAMLFEDLQERERKKAKTEASNKAQATHRRQGEICYEKTDDGCTVSTQNIITGKRRTRTTANFNEVKQGIAVFKHTKLGQQRKDTETTTTSPASQPTKERKKPGPKPKIKPELKLEQAKGKAMQKQNLKVPRKVGRPSRKTQLVTETKLEVKNEEEKTKEEEKDTVSLPNVTSIFDTFIQKILNPGTNADELINKLRDILSEQEVESLLSVRAAMLKKQETDKTSKEVSTAENKEASEEETSVVSANDNKNSSEAPSEDNNEKPVAGTENTAQANDTVSTVTEQVRPKTGPKTGRRSELDRLHEDIRDMFISEGVLTATGKRMCTFVDPCPTKTAEKEQNKAGSEINEETNSAPPSSPVQRQTSPKPRLRKSRVLLPTLKMASTTMSCSLRKRQDSHDTSEETDKDKDANIHNLNDNSMSSDKTELSSTTVATFSTISIEASENSMSSCSNFTKSDNEPLRRMPVLKAVKPIRLREEDELEEWKQKGSIAFAEPKKRSEKVNSKRYKPCPKSKKPPEALLNDEDDDADIEDSATEMMSEEPKIKTEILDISVPYKDVSGNLKNPESSLKNINPKWHWLSRYAHKCVVCKQKAVYMVVHLKRCHKENYISRLAPIILDQLKKPTTLLNKAVLYFLIKKSSLKLWLFRCPFCLVVKYTSFVGWYEHFLTHTGEHLYECTLCKASFNKLTKIEQHMKEKCAAHGGRYFHNDDINKSLKKNEITANVCHLCNYLRLGHRCLEQHYMEQHGYDVKSINDSTGFSITLMSTAGVPAAKTLDEIMEMQTKLIRQYETEIIFLSDDVVEAVKPSTAVKSTKSAPKRLVGRNKVATPSIENGATKTPTEKRTAKEKIRVSSNPTEETLTQNTNSQNTNKETSNAIKAVDVIKVSGSISSVFVSTTDDSNDGEAPTIFARKLLTVDDESVLSNNSSPKRNLAISMAERLSQRLKEAESNTTNSCVQKLFKEPEVNKAIELTEQSEENCKGNEPNTPIPEKLSDVEHPSKSSQENSLSSLVDEEHITQKEQPKDNTENAAIAKLSDKSDEGEVDLTVEEDDDDWEDIEVLETATSHLPVPASKEATTAKNKNNPSQKRSRSYSSKTPFSKLHKKSNSFKPLMTIFSGVNINKGSSLANKEPPKISSNDEVNSALSATSTSETTSTTTQPKTTSTTSSPAPVTGFHPMIANVNDFLQDIPSNESIGIVPEISPTSPLQDLNDITTFLGSNLSGLMDIDVEDPANSVCIHNIDNQQTSIQEALDFVAAQTVNYEQTQTLSQSLQSNNSNSDFISLAPLSVNRIQNIGFTTCVANEASNDQLNAAAFRFYCFSDRCTFLYSSEAIGLENHFLLEHPQSKWNGYCNTCSSQIKGESLSDEFKFSEEINHLLETHIKPTNTTIPNSTGPDAIQTETNSSSSSEQPRLKLRRLSGDCLSTATPLSNSPRSNFVDTCDESTSFSDLIRFNSRGTTPSADQLQPTIVPTAVACISDDVPFFTNVSKDFEITSISSGLEPTELSAIVKSALNAKGSCQNANATNSCNLQITNVVSLDKNHSSNEMFTCSLGAVTTTAEATALSLPKITNVCSLSDDSAARNTGSLWSQQIMQEQSDLSQSYAESVEISDILANASKRSNQNQQTPRRINNESPGLLVVSETLPTAQATSGNFVITQTVSAQYAHETDKGDSTAKPKVGFNISIASAAIANAKTISSSTSIVDNSKINSKTNSGLKPLLTCLEPGCKFTTRHLVATIDHVKWHEKKNDSSQHEYLRCSICKEKLLNLDSYTQHLRIEHYTSITVPTTPITDLGIKDVQSNFSSPIVGSCALRDRIRNILNQKPGEVTPKKPINGTQNSTLASGKHNHDSETISFDSQLRESIKEIVSKTGMSENKLFRCLVKDCNVKLNESSYHTHVLYHLSTFGVMNTTFSCPHCKLIFPSISDLKLHFKVHGRHTIFCYICMETAAIDKQMARHFAQKHFYKESLHRNIIAQWEGPDGTPLVYYVMNSSQLTENNVQDFSKKLVIECQRKKAAFRTHFKPSEVDLLPIQAIFSKEIFCAVCLYKTKVRTNMVRHMLQHKNTPTGTDINSTGAMSALNQNQKDGNANENSRNVMVCSMDPVNPVPCLISNEKHFDRMTNLASSSLVPQGVANVSSAVCKLRCAYIPQSKRFKCGVPGCEYLTIYEDIFRSHLHALHSDVRTYRCLFCDEELCKRSLVEERVIQHLRYHDRTLYQCEQCDHSHYIRHVVERHVLEKHATTTRPNILMFIRDEEGSFEGNRKVLGTNGKKRKDSNTNASVSNAQQSVANGNDGEGDTPKSESTSSSSKNEQKFPKFICEVCQHTTFTFNQVIAHCNSQHGLKQPFECPHCLQFTAWNEQNVKIHITDEHPGLELRVRRIFGKMTAVQKFKAKKEFAQQVKQTKLNEPPPKPLWQRDDPKRARQIRGIPMEDEEESERLRKRLRLSGDDDEDCDYSSGDTSSGNSLGQSVSNLYLNRFEFGCYHCEYKTNSIDDLKSNHWETSHNQGEGITSKPFLFRLLNRLKCAECQSFNGCFWELQKHMAEDHSKPTSHAADPRSKKLVCGYCEYKCTNSAQLLRHHLRDDHHPQDVKGLFSAQMAKVMRLECSSPVSYVHCTLCSELFNSRLAVVQHAADKHVDETEHFSFRELTNTTIYRCADCQYTSTNELTTLRHMVNHYRRFKRCHFCNQTQPSFNDYMQHCYSDHRAEIRRFSEIYPLDIIKKYLMQVLIIFPNGWIINKKNLCNTPYGNEERIKTLYAEICKTSQEPPIPRLSLGRLVARKSIEAKQQQQQLSELSGSNSIATEMQLAGNAVAPETKKQMSTQKISKRRSTTTVSDDDKSLQIVPKKPKTTTKMVSNRSAPPKEKIKGTAKAIDTNKSDEKLVPYSFYGKLPDNENWTELRTKISIAGIDTSVGLDKFRTLVKIDAYVALEKLDIKKYKLPQSVENGEKRENLLASDLSSQKNEQFKNVNKACPASQKYRFI